MPTPIQFDLISVDYRYTLSTEQFNLLKAYCGDPSLDELEDLLFAELPTTKTDILAITVIPNTIFVSILRTDGFVLQGLDIALWFTNLLTP